jgi:hypothetical protein
MAEGLPCNLDISKLQFLIKKRFKTFSAILFFFSFWSSKTLDPDSLEMLDSDPNPDPQL